MNKLSLIIFSLSIACFCFNVRSEKWPVGQEYVECRFNSSSSNEMQTVKTIALNKYDEVFQVGDFLVRTQSTEGVGIVMSSLVLWVWCSAEDGARGEPAFYSVWENEIPVTGSKVRGFLNRIRLKHCTTDSKLLISCRLM